MHNVIDRKSALDSQADATGISKAVVNIWFYNRQDATEAGYEKVFTDNGFGGDVLCYVSRSTLGLLPLDTDFLQTPAQGSGLDSDINMCFEEWWSIDISTHHHWHAQSVTTQLHEWILTCVILPIILLSRHYIMYINAHPWIEVGRQSGGT